MTQGIVFVGYGLPVLACFNDGQGALEQILGTVQVPTVLFYDAQLMIDGGGPGVFHPIIRRGHVFQYLITQLFRMVQVS